MTFKRTGIMLAAAGMILCFDVTAQNKSAAPASPPIDPLALVKELESHQHRLDQIRENYTFHEINKTDELDSKGVLKSSSTTENEVFFANGHRIRRLIRRNGAELSASDQKSEQDRVRKEVEKAIKSAPGSGASGREDSVSISQLLEVMNISNPRRTTINGRETLAFDFVGDRKAKTHGMESNAAKKMSGTLWIDAADHQVTKVEVIFDADFRIGGGLLVSVQKGTSIRMEQAHVGDGLWMPSTSELHIAARAFLVNAVRRNIHIQDRDFKRFDIGVMTQSPATVVSPNPR